MTALGLLFSYLFTLFLWWLATRKEAVFVSRRVYTIIVFTILLIAASISIEDKPKPFTEVRP